MDSLRESGHYSGLAYLHKTIKGAFTPGLLRGVLKQEAFFILAEFLSTCVNTTMAL